MNEHFKSEIEKAIADNKVMLYMRGTPAAPHCGFSARVVKTFKELGVPFSTDDMDRDPELWATLKEMNNWPTAPQVFVNGEFVGGCDIVLEMAKNGELQEMLGSAK